jgi:hypothetical protein
MRARAVLQWVAIGAAAAMAAAACANSDTAAEHGPIEDAGGGTFDASSGDAHFGFDAAHEAGAEAGVDSAADSATDSAPDAAADSAADSATDAPHDSPNEAANDAAADSPADSPTDSPADAPSDVAIDSPLDAPMDAPADAPSDASDAGVSTLYAIGTAGGASFLAQYTGTWTWATASTQSVDPPAIAWISPQAALGVARFTKVGDPADQRVQYTNITSLASTQLADIGPTVTTRGAPSLSAAGGKAQLAFQGTDYKLYFGLWDGATWSPSAEAVNQYGPVPPSIAARGADSTVAFLNGASSNALTVIDRNGGTWQSPSGLYNDTNITVSPTIVAMTQGPELMVAFVRGSDNAIVTITRTGGTWASSVVVSNATTQSRPALAALTNGNAILAFRGTDTNLYYSVYSSGAWSAVAAVATPNVSANNPPALTAGVGAATAEMVFVKSDNLAYHTRLVGGAWTTPASFGVTANWNVAIARSP